MTSTNDNHKRFGDASLLCASTTLMPFGTPAPYTHFRVMVSTRKPYADRMAKATPLTKAILELWRIITLILFVNKDAYNVSFKELPQIRPKESHPPFNSNWSGNNARRQRRL
jgi:hypothetical protein